MTKIVRAISDTIKEAGTVPAGTLYASLMGVMSLSQFDTVIGALVKVGKITRQGHMLIWKNPAK